MSHGKEDCRFNSENKCIAWDDYLCASVCVWFVCDLYGGCSDVLIDTLLVYANDFEML